MRTLIIMLGLVLGSALSAQDISREEIRRVPVPGSETMEVIVMKLTVPPGATIPLHSHNGDEHGVVLTASKAQTPSGQVVEFPVGATLYFPEGQVHGGLTNVGDAPMIAMTTFVVRVGEPLVVPAN